MMDVEGSDAAVGLQLYTRIDILAAFAAPLTASESVLMIYSRCGLHVTTMFNPSINLTQLNTISPANITLSI